MITLSDVCCEIVDCEHKTAPISVSGYPSIRTTDIKNGRILFDQANRVSKETYDAWTRRRTPVPGDLILAREAPVGEVGYIPEGQFPVLGQRTVLISPDREKVVPRFLHYLMISPEIQHELHVRSTGSTVLHLNMKDIRELELNNMPPLSEQREIAAILGALDDKIVVNHRASAILEEMARALYQSWFIDFDPVHARVEGRAPAHMDPATAALFPDSFGDNGLPEGWEFGRLADLAIQSKNSVKPEQIDPETPYIGLEHMPRRSIALNQWGTAGDVGSQKSAIRTGDFMFGKLRPYFHKVGVSPVNGICSTDIIVLRPITDEWSGLVLSVISSDEFVEHTNAGSAGTRMPRTKWADMGAYKIPVPPVAVGAAFEKLVKPWRDRIIGGIHENQTLAALRDALLPKLMSGEIRVEAARARIAEIA